MKTRLFKILTITAVLTALFALLALSANAEIISGYCGDEVGGANATWTLDTETGVLTVTGTGEAMPYEWSEYKDLIKTAEFSEGITSLGYGAFNQHPYLTSVSFSSSIKKIDDFAFARCNSLESIVIPEGIEVIGEAAFAECNNLAVISIPSTVRSIGQSAFSCRNLAEFLLSPQNASYSYENGILYNKNKTELVFALRLINNLQMQNFVIPASVTTVHDWAFNDFSSIESLTIPASVTSIGQDSLTNTYKLESITVDEQNPNYSSLDGVLFNKDKTTLIVYPPSKAGNRYYVPETVTRIEESAFMNAKFAGIYIPKSVEYIGESSYTSSSAVYYAGSEDEWNAIEIGMGNSFGPITYNATTVPNIVSGYCNRYDDVSNVKWTLDLDAGVLTISGSGYMYDYIRLSSTGIMNYAKPWRDYEDSIKKVVVEEGIIGIGSGVFLNLQQMTDVEIPTSVTEIGILAFAYCFNIENFTIDPQNTSYVYENGILYNIDKTVLEACVLSEYNVEYNIPASVTEIADYAFYGSSFKAVNVHSGVTTISQTAFENAYNLESINVDAQNANYSSIDGVLFTADKSILMEYPQGKPSISYSIPAGTMGIGANAFYYSNFSNIFIPSSVTVIGSGAFAINETKVLSVYYEGSEEDWANINIIDGNSSLLNSTIYYNQSSMPSGAGGSCGAEGDGSSVSWSIDTDTCVLTISGTGAMADYTRTNRAPWSDYGDLITAINIENGVTRIGDYAFSGCNFVRDVAIPASVASIGGFAFEYCYRIENLYIDDLSAWCGIDFEHSNSNPMNHTQYVYVDNQSITDFVIPSGVEEIKAYAFYGCSRIVSVTIPASVTAIGNDAFASCYRIENLYIDDLSAWCEIDFGNVEANPMCYASSCYFDGQFVTELVIPSGTAQIMQYAFYGNYRLTSVEIPASVEFIGIDAFKNCGQLEYINVDGQNANYLSENGVLFNKDKTELIKCPSNNPNEQVYTIPASVTKIAQNAFYSCYAFNTITIHAGVTSIGADAFYNCYNLDDINVVEQNAYYSSADGVLFNKDKTVLITYPAGRPSIPYSVPSGVERIEDNAITAGNGGSIFIPQSVTSIGDGIFGGYVTPVTVYYEGSEEDWSLVEIGQMNSQFTVNYNAVSMPRVISGYCGVNGNETSVSWECDLDTGVLIISGTGDMGEYNPWGEFGEIITEIIIEEGVSSLCDYAFSNCFYVREINLPASLVKIGIYSIGAVENIYADPQNTAFTSQDGVLYSKDMTELVVYPYGRSDIYYAVKSGVEIIRETAFNWLNFSYISIPASVTTICDGTFERGILTDVYYAGSETEWQAIAIGNDNYKLVNANIHFNASSDVIVSGYCGGEGDGTNAEWSLNLVTEEMTINGSGALADMIDWGGRYLGNNVKSVKILSEITEIDYRMFIYNLHNLESIEVDSENANYSSLDGVLFNKDMTELIYYPEMKKTAEYTIPAGVETIGVSAISSDYITCLNVPASLISFDDSWMFANMMGLESINVDIGNAVYYSVDGVLFERETNQLVTYPIGKPATEYAIPSGTKFVHDNAFYNNNLEELTIPESVISINPWALNRCAKLESITVAPENEEYYSIDGVLFDRGKNELITYPLNRAEAEYTIPNGVASIHSNAFGNNEIIESIIVSADLTYISPMVFVSCTNLESITVAYENEVYLSKDGVLFNKGKTELIFYPHGKTEASYTVPKSVSAIGEYAFERCNNLTSIIIQKSLCHIAQRAFYECNNLSDVYYTGTQTEWENILIDGYGNEIILNGALVHYNFVLEETEGVSVVGSFSVSNAAEDDITVVLMSGDSVAYTADVKLKSSTSTVSTFEFTFENVEEGNYKVVIRKAGHMPYTANNLAVGAVEDVNITALVPEIKLRAGDINGDGFVDSSDVSLFVFDMGKSDAEASSTATDLNDDGYRDATDVTILAHNMFSEKQDIDLSQNNG